jgi:hypothetical protein
MKVIKIIFAGVLIFAFALPGYGNNVKRKKNKWLGVQTARKTSEHENRNTVIGW